MKQFLATIASVCLAAACSSPVETPLTSYVDPMIGTDYTGHTFPGPILPFGFIAAGPDTGLKIFGTPNNEGWCYCSGYHYSDSSLMGFSQTHVSGTGAADMCDLMLIPVTGEPKWVPGTNDDPDSGYRSRFSHERESARPGYYSVRLDDYGIDCEITVSERCAVYRFAYPSDGQAGVLFDMGHGNADITLEGAVKVENSHAVSGMRRSRGFVRDHAYYFWAEFSEEFCGSQSPADSLLYVKIPSGRTLTLKLGMSTTGIEGARANLAQEIGDAGFDEVAEAADAKWNKALSLIRAECIDEDHARTFYTALYHSLIMPNLITDCDGSFHGWDGESHKSTSGDLYTNYSLWDTYRALHPFYNIVCPEMNVRFINSWLERYHEIGQLPINEYGICETFCMIGYHAVPVIADAVMQGLQGFDYELAYEAMKQVAEDPLRAVDLYKKYHYIPSGMGKNPVSQTVEYCYDDWCISQVAAKLGYADEAEYYRERSLYYRNHFDPVTGFLRGKMIDGSWNEPFDPLMTAALGKKDYTEGNAWQYTFYVPQDMTNYVQMLGGDDAFEAKLDEMFTTGLSLDKNQINDVTGLIGQYAHGNEPSHHAAYLYNFVGKPWKTQKLVAQIKKDFYTSSPDGLCGNDDCGQMSSWYVLSSLGFYPVTPAIGYFVIGSPSVKDASVIVRDGKVLHIVTRNASDENIYVQSMTLNGRPYTKSYIPVDELMAGAEIEFVMGSAPEEAWGSAAEDRPVSKVK